MSKTFDALRKIDGEKADLVIPLLAQPCLGLEQTIPGYEQAIQPREAAPEVRRPAIRTRPIRVGADSPTLPFDGFHAQASEQYRIVRTKILQHPDQPRILLVSSPMQGDGKTMTAVNLAGALALQEGVQVVLVDGDFRRPAIASQMGLEGNPGLREVLQGSATLEEALIQVEQLPNLFVLTQGEIAVTNPTELLASAGFGELCETLSREFRFAIFDAPPVGWVADYDLLQDVCDGVLLVMRLEHTNRKLCQSALETIPAAKQLGVILNCVEDWFLWRTPSYYSSTRAAGMER